MAICLTFAKKIITENKGVKVNWAKFVEATFEDQARHMNTKGVLSLYPTSIVL
jgi:hypothetical protein